MSLTSTIPGPTGIHDLPPEILASAFETMIYTSSADISLILPLTLVCRAWHDLITHTPRLWGILTLHRATDPRALAKRIARAKASPLSITVDTSTRVRDRQMGKQIKALADLVGNWVELDVGVEFLVAACELDRKRDRERERSLRSTEPLRCEPVLGWVDMYRSVHSLTLGRGQHEHETPGAFFIHGGGVPTTAAVDDVKLQSFTSVALPKPWIFGFLGPNIKNLRLLRGDRGMNPWAPVNLSSQSHIITLKDLLTMLSRVPNATVIELERTDAVPSPLYFPPDAAAWAYSSSRSYSKVIHLPFLRDLTLRGLYHSSFVLAALRAPALQTLSVTRADRVWRDPDQPLAPVFAQWSQPGFVMEKLHTLELVNCLKNDDDVPYLIRWLGRMKSLVRLFLVQELDSARGLGEHEEESEEEEEEEAHFLFKALASPCRAVAGNQSQAPTNLELEWLCPSLMILRVDLPDTPIHALISIARARGGIIPYPYSSPSPSLGSSKAAPSPPPPARLRSIETRLCAAAEQADIGLFKSLVDNPQCICMSCALHLPLDRLQLTDVTDLEV